MISWKTAIKREAKRLRESAEPSTEGWMAYDYVADQLDFLALAEDAHRDAESSCLPGCPWCSLEGKPTHNRICDCLNCREVREVA